MNLAAVAAAAPIGVAVEARAGDPAATLNLEAVAAPTPLDVALGARAGDPTAALNATAVAAAPPISIAVAVQAGDPTATVNLEAVPAGAPIDVAMEARAGAPTASFGLDVRNPPTLYTIPPHANEVVRALITCNDFDDMVARELWYRFSQNAGSVSADSDIEIQPNLDP